MAACVVFHYYKLMPMCEIIEDSVVAGASVQMHGDALHRVYASSSARCI